MSALAVHVKSYNRPLRPFQAYWLGGLILSMALVGCTRQPERHDWRSDADLVLAKVQGSSVLSVAQQQRVVDSVSRVLPMEVIEHLDSTIRRHTNFLFAGYYDPTAIDYTADRREVDYYAQHRIHFLRFRDLLLSSQDSTRALLSTLYVRRLEGILLEDSLKQAGLSDSARQRLTQRLEAEIEGSVGEDLDLLSLGFIDLLALPSYAPLEWTLPITLKLEQLSVDHFVEVENRISKRLIDRINRSDNYLKRLELCRLLLQIERAYPTDHAAEVYALTDSILRTTRIRLDAYLDAGTSHQAARGTVISTRMQAAIYNYTLVNSAYSTLLDARRQYRRAAKLLYASYTFSQANEAVLGGIFEDNKQDLFQLAEKARIAQQYKIAGEISEFFLRKVFSGKQGSPVTDGRNTARLAYWVGTYYQRIATPDSALAYYHQLLHREFANASSTSTLQPIDSLFTEGLYENIAEVWLDQNKFAMVDSVLRLMLPLGAASGHKLWHSPSVPYQRIAAQLAFKRGDYATTAAIYSFLTDPKNGETPGSTPLDDYHYLLNRKHTIYQEFGASLLRIGREHEAVAKMDSAYKLQGEILQRSRYVSEGLAEATEEAQRAEYALREEREQLERSLQQRVLAIVTGALVLLSIGFVVLAQNRKKILLQNERIDAANREIMSKSSEVENAYEEIQAINEELSSVNDFLAVQNTNIEDSINYARRIQHALLPDAAIIEQAFVDHCLFFKPRDIVSGDFYWVIRLDQVDYVAVADCTGHGVPGAFMSIIGMNLLDQIITEWHVTAPNQALPTLHAEIIRVLKQQSGETRDGMDIALIRIDRATQRLQFSGAHHSLHLLREGELEVYRADRKGLGGLGGEADLQFTEHEVAYKPGHRLYVSTDGYLDQFNAAGKLKFGAARFGKLLIEIQASPMRAQSEIVAERFEQWRGDYRQLDDVLVFGVEL
jgi:serine phosphatase RsbU (regulator of sigma subunit)